MIKLGALGDFFLAQTAFEALRAHHAQDHLSLMTLPVLAGLAQRSGLFDEVLTDPRGRSLSDWLTVRRTLRSGRFDRVYDLQGQSRTRRYFYLLAPGPWPEWSGPVRWASHPDLYPNRQTRPAVERHRAQLAPFGINLGDHPRLDWLDTDIGGFGLPARFAVLFPGSAPHRPEKRWPAERYGALATALLAAGFQPVILGTKAETPIAEAIRKGCPQAVDLTGKTSLLDLAGLARHATVAIGNDTGPTHLAAALGTPTVALFGDDASAVQVSGARIHPLRRPTLAGITVDEVMAAVADAGA